MAEAESKADQPQVILASASPRRLSLLQQIGIEPVLLLPTDIDETPRRNEAPRTLAARLATEKAQHAAETVARRQDLARHYIVAADTVVSVGRRILPKCDTSEQAIQCLRLLSGRAHRVFTGVTMITPHGKLRHRMVETRVRLKRLSGDEIDAYVASGEWEGKAGGYAIQGLAAAFVVRLLGSHSGVIGLPLYETASLLAGEGLPSHKNWGTR